MKSELIAPCGMNCRLCFGYIRPRNPCQGCRAPDSKKAKSCIHCKIIVCEKRNSNNWPTCALCDTPCRRLKDLDKQYRAKYHMSMLENLTTIRQQGMDLFLQQEEEKYRCATCGSIVSVHMDACPSCKTLVWE